MKTDMLKVRRANFLDFFTVNSIYKNYFDTDSGRKNTTLLYQFILLLINDFLRVLNLDFLETYYLEKNGKIVGIHSNYIFSRDRKADNGICIIPEERGKGLAKYLISEDTKIFRKKGVKYSYFLSASQSLDFVTESKAKIITIFHHYRGNWEILETTHDSSVQLCKYKIKYFPSVLSLIESTTKTNSFFTSLFFKPPKNNLFLFLEKIYFLLEVGKIWRYCIKKEGKIIGYLTMTYYPRLREFKVYILVEEKINHILNEFDIIFKQNKIPVSKLDFHIFTINQKKETIFVKGFTRTNILELRRIY